MEKPIAVVLASSGEHKLSESYFGKPQELYTADILDSMGLESFLTQRSASSPEGNYPVLSDLYPGLGVIQSIIALMTDKNVTTALLVPCDMPLLDTEILQQLIDHYEEEDTIVCFRQHGTPYIEPFPAIFEKDVLELLVKDVVAGKITLQELLKHTGSHLVEIPKDDRLLNVSDADERAMIIEKLANEQSSHKSQK